jgi:hypothetical protein
MIDRVPSGTSDRPEDPALSHEMQHARVSGPVLYASDGAPRELPRGPCLMERIDDRRFDVIWGDSGEHSAEIPVAEIERAADDGDLVLLR